VQLIADKEILILAASRVHCCAINLSWYGTDAKI